MRWLLNKAGVAKMRLANAFLLQQDSGKILLQDGGRIVLT